MATGTNAATAPARPVTGFGTTLRPEDVRHRQEFADYSCTHGQEWWRAHLGRLYYRWDDANARFFAGRLIRPHILLSEPRNPRAYATHASVSGWGSRGEVRIRPSLLRGDHPQVRPGDEYTEGRLKLVEDILLHETIHQYHHEVTGKTEASYHGHGPAFAAECNRIGGLLGLTEVRPIKRRGKGKGLPSCAHWPLIVRPRDYYQGAFMPPVPDEADEPDPAAPAGPPVTGDVVPVTQSPFERACAEFLRAALEVGALLSEEMKAELRAEQDGGHTIGDSEYYARRLIELAGRFHAVARNGQVGRPD